MKRLVVFTGSGISAESGIRTFRGYDGLWENYRIEEVATPQAWESNPELVLEFYNQRRRQVLAAEPNPGHKSLANLEQLFDVYIITQNIDDLHERAGSSRVLHLHGEILKARSTADPSLVYPVKGSELHAGDRCEKGSPLRPHIVWFGEMVPELDRAAELVSTADIVLVVGTSLAVYPAAGLIHYARERAEKILVDPDAGLAPEGFRCVRATAGLGLPALADAWFAEALAAGKKRKDPVADV